MPDRRVPAHLHGLPRDPVTGWPAPYVNAWEFEGEDQPWTVGSFDGQPAFMPPSRLGEGAVDFTRAHMARQRLVTVGGFCQVCRRQPAPYLIVGPHLSGKITDVDGVRWCAFTEPWLCTRCATFATTHCPGLIRLRRNQQVDVIRPSRVKIVLSSGTHDGHPGVVGVMWAKLVVPLRAMPDGAEDWFPAWQPT